MFSLFKKDKCLDEHDLDEIIMDDLNEQLRKALTTNSELKTQINVLKDKIAQLDSELIERDSKEEIADCWVDFKNLNAMTINRRSEDRTTVIMYMVNDLTRITTIKCSLHMHNQLVEQFKKVTK